LSQNWRPSAPLANLKRRAQILALIRQFFAERDVWEVDTPQLSAGASTDPNLDSLVCAYCGPGAPPDGRLWLHTSPEFAMKRLLAAGSESIYQICHAFRGGERGRRHNPEFTLLEWYRTGFDHHQLMAEVAALAEQVLGPHPRCTLSYREAFRQYAQVDPWEASEAQLLEAARVRGVAPPAQLQGHDACCDLLFSHVIGPALRPDAFTFIVDFPPTQAALARVRADEPPVAERFELFIGGMEIANGFHELVDPLEQRRRFEQEQASRQSAGLPLPALDARLIAALEAGLPPCAGVALGLDRLLMLACGAVSIDEVIAFPIERA
jgi:elongation factor P--(R)-beta-lysine ligase